MGSSYPAQNVQVNRSDGIFGTHTQWTPQIALSRRRLVQYASTSGMTERGNHCSEGRDAAKHPYKRPYYGATFPRLRITGDSEDPAQHGSTPPDGTQRPHLAEPRLQAERAPHHGAPPTVGNRPWSCATTLLSHTKRSTAEPTRHTGRRTEGTGLRIPACTQLDAPPKLPVTALVAVR